MILLFIIFLNNFYKVIRKEDKIESLAYDDEIICNYIK